MSSSLSQEGSAIATDPPGDRSRRKFKTRAQTLKAAGVVRKVAFMEVAKDVWEDIEEE